MYRKRAAAGRQVITVLVGSHVAVAGSGRGPAGRAEPNRYLGGGGGPECIKSVRRARGAGAAGHVCALACTRAPHRRLARPQVARRARERDARAGARVCLPACAPRGVIPTWRRSAAGARARTSAPRRAAPRAAWWRARRPRTAASSRWWARARCSTRAPRCPSPPTTRRSRSCGRRSPTSWDGPWRRCGGSGRTSGTRTRGTCATRRTGCAPGAAAWCRAGTSPTSWSSCGTTWPPTRGRPRPRTPWCRCLRSRPACCRWRCRARTRRARAARGTPRPSLRRATPPAPARPGSSPTRLTTTSTSSAASTATTATCRRPRRGGSGGSALCCCTSYWTGPGTGARRRARPGPMTPTGSATRSASCRRCRSTAPTPRGNPPTPRGNPPTPSRGPADRSRALRPRQRAARLDAGTCRSV